MQIRACFGKPWLTERFVASLTRGRRFKFCQPGRVIPTEKPPLTSTNAGGRRFAISNGFLQIHHLFTVY